MFKIPNSADAENASQAQVDARDLDILVAALQGTGWVSGCAVTAQGSPNMTLAVASGSIAVAGAVAAVSAGNVTITAANATNDRFDLVCVASDGTKSVVAGTASTNPVFPDPAGKVVLAAVRVPATATSINTAKIVDKRAPAVPAFTIADASITGAKLVADTITATQIAADAITASELANNAVDAAAIAANAVTRAKLASDVMQGKRIEAGIATTDGSGNISVSFGTAFASAPAVVLTAMVGAGDGRAVCTLLTTPTTTGFTAQLINGNTGGSIASTPVHWIAIGS